MANQLRIKGYNTSLVCRPDSLLEQAARESDLPCYQANFRNSLDLGTVIRILSLIRKLKIDLIVCSTTRDIKLAGLAGKLANIPVISRQGLALIPDNHRYKFLVRNFTSSIITNTITIKNQFENYGWFPKDHIQVIYNGVAPQQPETQKQDIRQQHLNSSDKKLIVSAGRLNTQKGFRYLIEAAHMAQQTNKPWKFVILGDGEEKKHLTKLITKYQLRNIALLGFHKNIQDYYTSADLFVLSSLAEGTPNVVLEAMSCGCPVIATDVNGVREVIEHKSNGYIIPPMDSMAIYQGIESCFNEPELLKKMADRAYLTIQDKFTVEKSVHQFIEYITNIITKYEEDHHKNA